MASLEEPLRVATTLRAARPPSGAAIGAGLRRVVPMLAGPVVLLAAWQIYCTAAHVDPIVLPTPWRVLTQLSANWSVAWQNGLQTIKETAIGMSVSVVFSVVIATLMDQVTWVRRAIYPMLVASQTVPIIAIAPLMIVWFGFGLLPKVLLIVLATFFPLTVAILDGFATTEKEMGSLLQTMGATKHQVFRLVRFPAAMPYLFTGLRISAAYAVVAAIFAEYVGAYNGLGIWMSQAKNSFRTDLLFGAIVISAVISVLLFGVVALAGRVVMPWFYAARKRA